MAAKMKTEQVLSTLWPYQGVGLYKEVVRYVCSKAVHLGSVRKKLASSNMRQRNVTGRFEPFLTQRRIYSLLAAFVLVAAGSLLFSSVTGGSGSSSAVGSGYSGAGRSTKADKVLVDEADIPTNSRFHVSKTSKLYEVNPTPRCWLENCRGRNNKRVYRSCTPDGNDAATEWNLLGARAMERYVEGGETKTPVEYSSRILQQAYYFFTKAVETDPKCKQAILNLAVVESKLNKQADAVKHFEQASEMFQGSVKDLALVELLWGFLLEKSGDRTAGIHHYDRVRELDKDTEKQWWGIAIASSDRAELRHVGTTQIYEPLMHYILYKYFAKIPISQYALLEPNTQDWFIEENWIAIKRVLPPFVLAAMQKCYNDLISAGQLPFGDTQAKRYTTHNDRCGRFIQYQIADLMATVIAHNVKPTYTYFGGYKGPNSELAPHNDREQCEFTMSFTIDQDPLDQPWPLSAKDHHGKEVTAELMPGDGFIFMGRTLLHWRKGALAEGRHVWQIFMHFVNEKFSKSLN